MSKKRMEEFIYLLKELEKINLGIYDLYTQQINPYLKRIGWKEKSNK